MRIEWHPGAIDDVSRLSTADQQRIRKATQELKSLDDPRKRLVPYTATLKGFWKLRVGDYRLVCQLQMRGDEVVLIIHVAHRSSVYAARSLRTIKRREEP